MTQENVEMGRWLLDAGRRDDLPAALACSPRWSDGHACLAPSASRQEGGPASVAVLASMCSLESTTPAEASPARPALNVDAGLAGLHDRLRAVDDLELVEDVGDVVAHRLSAEA
jgi:hypothetical protein